MKAYRNFNGTIREIEVDVSPTGEPLLPPNTTVHTKPTPAQGHTLTIVGNAWVQVPLYTPTVTFEELKARKIAAIGSYKNWILGQPFIHDGRPFDGDSTARERLTQALVMAGELGYVPPTWICADNTEYTIADVDALKAIAAAAMTSFSTRFYQCSALRSQALAATNANELNLVIIPNQVQVQPPTPVAG